MWCQQSSKFKANHKMFSENPLPQMLQRPLIAEIITYLWIPFSERRVWYVVYALHVGIINGTLSLECTHTRKFVRKYPVDIELCRGHVQGKRQTSKYSSLAVFPSKLCSNMSILQHVMLNHLPWFWPRSYKANAHSHSSSNFAASSSCMQLRDGIWDGLMKYG